MSIRSMTNLKSVFFCLMFLAALAPLFFQPKPSFAELQTQSAVVTREDAYRANNIGVALLEQFKYKEGADAFHRALQIDTKLNLAHINLSIALFNIPDLPAASSQAQKATTLAPNAPQPYYILGLIAKTQSRAEEAVSAFQRVLKIDPNDVGTNINLGQIYSQQRKYPEAIAAFRLALAAEPYNATALYNLGQALMRGAQREEGLKATARFQELRQRGSATTIGQNYLEQGRYAEAVASTGAESELVDRTIPAVTFKDANSSLPSSPNTTSAAAVPPLPVFGRQIGAPELNDEARRDIAASLGRAATLFDFDNDGDLDLFQINLEDQRLLRNDGGKFIDVTSQAGALSARVSGTAVGSIAGDFDNDGKPDLFVIRDGGLSLYHNDGNSKFSDVTATAGIPSFPYLPSSAAFVDVDHDGDLDIFVAGLTALSRTTKGGVFPDDFPAAPNLLLRNDGNGKFTDVTTAAKLITLGHAALVVPTDFNNRRDMDLLIVNYGKAPDLFSNQRDGTFRNITKDVGLDVVANWISVAAGDVNKDGYTDFFFGRADGPGLFAISDGKEKFKTIAAPAGSEAARAAQFLDYDNDGLLDCVMLTDKGVRVWRNFGDGWMDTSARAVASDLAGGPAMLGAGRLFAASDIDNNGDKDIIVRTSSG